MDEIIQGIAIYALPVIFAITMHEAAHGYIAKHFGDFTAFNEGRISLNPIRHIDLIGTILVPLTLFVLSKLTIGAGFLFGWAKPVPVNFSNLRQPKRDMLWVAMENEAYRGFADSVVRNWRGLTAGEKRISALTSAALAHCR